MRKIIFSILFNLRNPSFKRIHKELKKNEKLSSRELKKIQLNKLRSILIYAFENSKFYRKKFEKEKINVYALDIVSEYSKIIPIQKNDLIESCLEIQTQGKHKFIAKTSGTSGQKLMFTKSELWDSYNRASIARGYSWHGAKFTDLKIYFWGFEFDFFKKVKTRVLDFLSLRVRIFTFNKIDLEFALKQRNKIEIIEGYSSLINQLAEYCLLNNIDFPNLKLVKATSETILDNYRDNVKKAFNINLSSEYGSAEAGIIAFSCVKNKLHINLESVFIEDYKNEIILTNLNSFSFPIIKYKQGDYIDYSEGKFCSCGLPHPVLDNVIGRMGQDVFGNKFKYPSLLFYNIFKNVNSSLSSNIGYYIEQHHKGILKVYLKHNEDNSSKIENSVKREFYKYCSEDIAIDFEIFKNKLQKIDQLPS